MDPGEPLPFECLPGPGAAKGRNKRRSSILKQARPVLQDLNTNAISGPPPTNPAGGRKKEERSRRVSFSRKQQIKEFQAGQDNLTLWNNSYHEDLSNASAGNSSSSNSSKGSKSELSGGQLSSVSPSKALPLNIAIPPANSPNKFLASHTMETADFLQPQDAVDTTDFLSSLGAARRESESTDGEGETSFSRMISDMGSKTVMGEVDMSRTLAAMSDSMLPDDTLEEDGVNAMGFLAGLQDTSVSSGVSVRSAGNKTTLGGGMDMTLAPTAPFTSREGGVDRTMMGGGMDMTLAPTIATDRTMMGGGMDMTLAPTTPATSKDRTMIGGGMDMTLAQQLDLETTVSGQPNSTLALGDDSVFAPRHPSVADLPDSLPNSNNSSFDCGATATVKFSSLALANNTLVLPRHESQEDEEEDEFTKAPVQFFSYDPAAAISKGKEPVPATLERAPSILRKEPRGEERQVEGEMEMTMALEKTMVEGVEAVREKGLAGGSKEMTVIGERDMEMTVVGGRDMEMTRVEERVPEVLSMSRTGGNRTTVQGQDMEMTRVQGHQAMTKVGRDKTTLGGAEMEMTRLQEKGSGSSARSVSRSGGDMTTVQREDMEMARTGGDKTTLGGVEMEMTVVQEDPSPPKRSRIEKPVAASPSSQEVQEGSEQEDSSSGWETLHNSLGLAVSPLPVVVVSSPAPQALPRRSQGEELRQQFPSPVGEEESPSPTRMVRAMPRRPKLQQWEGDVTSFMPTGESTRAINFRLPALASPNLSPLPVPGRRDLANLTSFQPMEEFESTRKAPTLPLPAFHKPTELANVTSFQPMEEYESTRKLPSLPSLLPVAELGNVTSFSPAEGSESTRKLPPALACLSSADSVTAEVTSPNSAVTRLHRETMLPGLEITAAPGCSCVDWRRGEEEDRTVGCAAHPEGQDTGSAQAKLQGLCTVRKLQDVSSAQSQLQDSSAAQGQGQDTSASRPPPQDSIAGSRVAEAEAQDRVSPGLKRLREGEGGEGGKRIRLEEAGQLVAGEAAVKNVSEAETAKDVSEVETAENVSEVETAGDVSVVEAAEDVSVVETAGDVSVVETAGDVSDMQAQLSTIGERLRSLSTSVVTRSEELGSGKKEEASFYSQEDEEVSFRQSEATFKQTDASFKQTDASFKQTEPSMEEEHQEQSQGLVQEAKELDREAVQAKELAQGAVQAMELEPQAEQKEGGGSDELLENIPVVEQEDFEEQQEIQGEVLEEIPVVELEAENEDERVVGQSPETEDVVELESRSRQAAEAMPREILEEEMQEEVEEEKEEGADKQGSAHVKDVETLSLEPQETRLISDTAGSREEGATMAATGALPQAAGVSEHNQQVTRQETTVNNNTAKPVVEEVKTDGLEKVATSETRPRGLPQDCLVSVFTDLSCRQSRDPQCQGCGASHGAWQLVCHKPERDVAAVTWLEGSLMLVIRTGERLKPKRSRKTGESRSVEHFTVTELSWQSLHLREGEEGDEEDQCTSEAQAFLTRRFSPASMATDCPNTYSLAALLKKISVSASHGHTYLNSLNKVRNNFAPFGIKDGLVTVGFVSLPLRQSFHISVDFSAGFSSAPASVRIVRSIGASAAGAVERLAASCSPGPEYVRELAARLEEYLRNKESSLVK